MKRLPIQYLFVRRAKADSLRALGSGIEAIDELQFLEMLADPGGLLPESN